MDGCDAAGAHGLFAHRPLCAGPRQGAGRGGRHRLHFGVLHLAGAALCADLPRMPLQAAAGVWPAALRQLHFTSLHLI